jgi:FSR family fosmidomycin resistance protein-like MFS transporter
MAALSLGHLSADLSQGALPAVLVFLKPVLHLSYTRTAVVVLVATLTASVAQPLFGIWSDRRRAVWLTWFGVGLGGIGIALAGLTPNYGVLLGLVAVSGLGIGAFHPEGMRAAHAASGRKRASGMALFSTGGNLGFSLGPLIASGAIAGLGLSGGVLLVVPAMLVAAILLAERDHLASIRPHTSEVEEGTDPQLAIRDQPGAFKLLQAVVALRSVAYFGLFTFIPLWEVHRGHSKSYGNLILSAVLLAGVAGTLVAGPLADRYGRKRVLVASLLLSPGLIAAYVVSGGFVGTVCVCLAGAVVISTFSVTIVMSQEYLPSRIALASGLSVGLAMGLGGIAAVILGGIADSIDLRTALFATAAGPALGVLLAVWLPHDPHRQHTRLAAATSAP